MRIIEELICPYKHTQNGSSPVWCFGSTVIMRMGDTVFCTVPQAGFDVLPLNDRHIELYRKCADESWELVWRDTRFTREPAPLLRKDEHTLLMTANPTLIDIAKGELNKNIISEPLLYAFDIVSGDFEPKNITKLTWDEPDYYFMDHSYRGGAIDRDTGDIFLTQQYVTSDAGAHCYAIHNREGDVVKTGKLDFPVRSCYHNLAIRNGGAYILAVSDIHEPVKAWADYKYEKTGIYWDYDFRNLYFKYTDDAYNENFSDTAIVGSREDTCGFMRNIDIYVDASRVCHILYSTRRIWHEFMRDRFFPDVSFDASLEYCAIKNGKIIMSTILDKETELSDRKNVLTTYWAAFHEQADGQLLIIANKSQSNGTGMLMEGWHLMDFHGSVQKLDIKSAPVVFLPARQHCGNLPSNRIDLFLQNEDEIQYIGIEL